MCESNLSIDTMYLISMIKNMNYFLFFFEWVIMVFVLLHVVFTHLLCILILTYMYLEHSFRIQYSWYGRILLCV